MLALMGEPHIRASVEAYIAAWNEKDASARRRLLERSCAEDVVLRTSGRRCVGRAELDALVDEFQRRRPGDRAVLVGDVDVQGHLFRLVGVVESATGARSGESFDAGECDDEGRIRLLLTFAGTLPPGPAPSGARAS